VKDGFAMVVILLVFAYVIFYIPDYLGHADNYIEANPLKTPSEIVPEWYFLPFYAMLRAITFNIGPINSKLGGVLVMFGSIVLLFLVPWLDTSKVRSAVYRPWYKLFFWIFLADVVMLGWLGSKPPQGIYPTLALIGAIFYYVFFLVIMPILGLIETPRKLPNSITESVLEKKGGGGGTPAGAAAAPETRS
jgi:ubiquinol-cytochrome c reductase cytochrome b subunit